MREGMEPKKIQTKTIMVYIGSTREDLKWTIVYGVPSPLGIEMMWQFRKWQSTWYSSAFLIGFQTLTRDLLRKHLQFEWAFSHACIYIYISYNSSQAAWGMRRMNSFHGVTDLSWKTLCHGEADSSTVFFCRACLILPLWTNGSCNMTDAGPGIDYIWHLISGYLNFLKPSGKRRQLFSGRRLW